MPCVSLDYACAGLFCARHVMGLDCTDVVLIAGENDSRTYSIGEGCRQAVRRAGGPMHRMVTVDGNVIETLCSLQERGLLVREGRKLGLLCADGGLGEDVLR